MHCVPSCVEESLCMPRCGSEAVEAVRPFLLGRSSSIWHRGSKLKTGAPAPERAHPIGIGGSSRRHSLGLPPIASQPRMTKVA